MLRQIHFRESRFRKNKCVGAAGAVSVHQFPGTNEEADEVGEPEEQKQSTMLLQPCD
jgi:hypothetical protein